MEDTEAARFERNGLALTDWHWQLHVPGSLQPGVTQMRHRKRHSTGADLRTSISAMSASSCTGPSPPACTAEAPQKAARTFHGRLAGAAIAGPWTCVQYGTVPR